MRQFNYRATIAYDGFDFFGFQRQYGLPTVQVAVEDAIWEGLGIRASVYGSSRTDKGVHALGQVISFSIDQDLHPLGMKSMISAYLPSTITLKNLERAPYGFIARFAQRTKSYAYIVYTGKNPTPMINRFSMVYPDKRFDFDKLTDAFKRFEGKHDFKCFGKASKESANKDPVCTVLEADTMQKGDYAVMLVKGDRFLHNMVRRMAGFALLCSVGKEDPNVLESIFEGNMRASAGMLSPAQGLYLVCVDYLENT
ncbi:MAG TPA: tRNA pseudouridine(38-40) synthase TruA [Caldisericia bacterium]|nr:tRNA pseudouridine(38-40) synthase TruA [Caldisericia bacterium]HPF49312.1 tRNA pseudouridine(38-40) synthase TruA [Caldisericia bacterium]HPI84008.1 tRNA pseudouridine(38-40) synthase TruA [Caldisericia bacterium]HPQ93266.1 tRNA pseudouridine(38-40) synthase TruA [Caldisericia bacterium]HRV75352.1 tRNA pseudouridine(38-40) synthase TruA [Caldisericia bacterium]